MVILAKSQELVISDYYWDFVNMLHAMKIYNRLAIKWSGKFLWKSGKSH